MQICGTYTILGHNSFSLVDLACIVMLVVLVSGVHTDLLGGYGGVPIDEGGHIP